MRDLHIHSGVRSPRPFQILSLSGGGYRGLFTAAIVEKLEADAKQPLRETFDLISGTSIGGIIACGLACGVPAADIRRAIEARGPAIFDAHARAFGLRLPVVLPRLGILRNRYNARGLAAAVSDVLGNHAAAPISSLAVPLLVVAVDRTNAAPQLFESEGMKPPTPCHTSLSDIAMATSAAPTYFPEHRIGARNMIDGGVIANAPDALALLRALGRFGKTAADIRMISIGTAGASLEDIDRPARGYGALTWVAVRRLFDVTIKAQETLSIECSREVLGDRLIRIDRLPSAKREVAIGLDKTGAGVSRILLGMAQQALDALEPSDQQILGGMLRQTAQWAILIAPQPPQT